MLLQLVHINRRSPYLYQVSNTGSQLIDDPAVDRANRNEGGRCRLLWALA